MSVNILWLIKYLQSVCLWYWLSLFIFVTSFQVICFNSVSSYWICSLMQQIWMCLLLWLAKFSITFQKILFIFLITCWRYFIKSSDRNLLIVFAPFLSLGLGLLKQYGYVDQNKTCTGISQKIRKHFSFPNFLPSLSHFSRSFLSHVYLSRCMTHQTLRLSCNLAFLFHSKHSHSLFFHPLSSSISQ